MPKALIVEILGNATGFARELDRAAGKTQQFGRAAGVAGVAIAGGLAYGLEKSVHAAMDAQVSTAKLDAAFTSSGENAKAYAGAIDAAESSGRNLGFSNIDMRSSLGTLEVATHNGTQAIKELSVAEDLARFKHEDLAAATKSLTMASAGSTRALHELGLQTQSVTTAEDKVKAAFAKHSGAAYTAALATAKLQDKQATAANVIQLVSDKMHGQAQAFADTAAGGMAQFHAQIESLQENLGQTLLPALQAVTTWLATATGWLTQHSTVAKIAVVAIGGLAAVLLAASAAAKISTAATTLWNVATGAAQLAAKAFTAAQWLLNAALDANPIGLVVIALVALGAAFLVAWQKSQTFRDIVKGAFQDVKAAAKTVADFFTNDVPQAADDLKNKVTNAFGDVKTWLSNHWPVIATLISGPFAPLVAVATNAFGIRSALQKAWTNIKSDVGSAFSAIGSAAKVAFVAPIDAIIGAIDAIALPDGVNIKTKKILGVPVPDGFSVSWGHPFHIPMLAEGGIATGPTLAMIGEAGPEAVIPLGGKALGGGTTKIEVNVGPVNGSVDPAFARTLANEIATQLRGGRVPQLQQAIAHN